MSQIYSISCEAVRGLVWIQISLELRSFEITTSKIAIYCRVSRCSNSSRLFVRAGIVQILRNVGE